MEIKLLEKEDFKNINSIEDLQKDKLDIIKILNERELENIKYIASHTKVFISDLHNKNANYYDNVSRIVNRFIELKKNNFIDIDITDKKKFNELIPLLKEYKNIYVTQGTRCISLDKYIDYENRLTGILDDVSSDLSPFEKYLKIYNITSKFKEYKENEMNKMRARNLYDILDNEYMVCVGYRELLIDLLKKVNIEAYDYYVAVDISYEEGFTKEEKNLNHASHTRIIVNLKDDKYNIDGYYVADPTFDNSTTNDYFNHAFMTFRETASLKNLVGLDEESLVFDVNNFEEYNRKINILIDKYIRGNKSSCTYKEKNISATEKTLRHIMNILYDLDRGIYNELLDEYNRVKDSGNINDFINIFTKIGLVMVKKNNNKIDRNTFYKAVANIKDIDIDFINTHEERDLKARPYNEDWTDREPLRK